MRSSPPPRGPLLPKASGRGLPARVRRPLRSVTVVAGLVGFAGLALAGNWSEFGAAFPGLPCQDGWASCLVDGQRLSPGMVLDSSGRPHPSDMRLGFFEFDALPALSPFSGLSSYTGEGVEPAGGDAVADAEPPAPVEPVETEASRQAVAAAEAAEASERAAREESESRARAEAAARQQAEEAERAAAEAARKAAEASKAATDEAARKEAERQAAAAREAAEAARKKAEEESRRAAEAAAKAEEEARRKAEADAARKKAEDEARRQAEEAARVAAERAAAEEAARKAAEAAAAATAVSNPPPDQGGDAVADASPPPAGTTPAAPASCDNLVSLEVPAMMGQLGTGVRSCLEDRLASSGAQTTKDKISRVLIADAEARRDQGDWERLMKRHLENIDRSDPNMCFKYALHLSRGGAGRATGVIRWADYALENKQQWQGAAYTKNVSGLYKIRAQAANKLWQSAEQALVEDRNDENEAKAERYRGTTKDYAREWLDYARASGQETSAAMALCVSAAGSKEFCGG